MATPVIMPKFGMAQEEGTIIRWLKREGDAVTKGEVILEVQTDKVDMEVESPATGILRDVRYGVDATVAVTTVIAEIAAPDEESRILHSAPPAPTPQTAQAADAPQAAAAAQPAPAQAAARVRVSPVAQRKAAAQGVDLQQVKGSGPAGRILGADVERVAQVFPSAAEVSFETAGALRATPAARRLARAAGVDLAHFMGSGPGGRIQAADVANMRPVQPTRPDPLPASTVQPGEPLRGMRRTIATRLGQSWRDIPHIFLTTSVDMSELLALRAALAAELAAGAVHLTLTTLLAFATTAALARRPRLNALLRTQEDVHYLSQEAEVHLGFAVALDDGLIVPVIHNASALKLSAFAAQMESLTARARSGALAPDDVAGGTFTLSNLGMYAVDNFTALINPPQVAILAVGRMQMQPLWDGSAFAPRPLVELTLSADHRAVDGALAAQFLGELKGLCEEPRRLLL